MNRKSYVVAVLVIVLALCSMLFACSTPLEVPHVDSISVHFAKDMTLKDVELSLGFSWKNENEPVLLGSHYYNAIYTDGKQSAETKITVVAKPTATMVDEDATIAYIEGQLTSDDYKKGGAMYESVAYDQYVMILARSYNGIKPEIKSAYMARVKDIVLSNIDPKTNIAVLGDWADWSSQKYTTNTVLALLALKESTTIDGVDLLAPYYDINILIKNASIYDLATYVNVVKNIAIPTKYATKDGVEHVSNTTLTDVVNIMLGLQIAGGGWSYASTESNIDLDATTFALAGLSDIEGIAELDEALVAAKAKLDAVEKGENGGLMSWGSENKNSTATAMTAYAALGVDITTVKNDESSKTILDFMTSCRMTNGAYTMDSTAEEVVPNGLLTKDAAIALVSYNRYLRGEANFYNMK